jgi:hypothetical protein
MVAQVVGELGAQTVTVVNATFADGLALLATAVGPLSTISFATLPEAAGSVAIVLPPAVEVTVVVGVVGVVGVLGLPPLPPQPTATAKPAIKITKPIFCTFSPLTV